MTALANWAYIVVLVAAGNDVSAAARNTNLGALAQRGPGGPLPVVLGTWDVEQVAVDEQDRMHWDYRPNDPQLMGRELVIDAGTVRFNGRNWSCKQSVWTPRSTTWGSLIAKAFARPVGGGRPATPTPSDFNLKFPKAGAVTAYPLCSGSDANPDAVFPHGQWVAVKGPNTLAFRMEGPALLILTRRPAGAKPRASFPCGKATTPTEKAICGDFALAAWDRSVAAAWREAMNSPAKNQDELSASQKEWLRQRDACGTDVACLAAEMFQRVNALTRMY